MLPATVYPLPSVKPEERCPPTAAPDCCVQALSALVEHSGCDVRTAINTLQLLARQHAPPPAIASSSPGSQHASSQQRRQRVRITAADIAGSRAFGVKDVSHTPIGVVRDMLASSSSKAMAARLQQLAAAMKGQQRGAAAAAAARAGPGGRGTTAPVGLSAAAAARLALQEQYGMLLDLGEHEQVGPGGEWQGGAGAGWGGGELGSRGGVAGQ